MVFLSGKKFAADPFADIGFVVLNSFGNSDNL